MNIGIDIDIDDTLTNTNEASEEYVLKYEREHPNIKLDHYKLIRGNIDTPEAKKKFVITCQLKKMQKVLLIN